jgi:hypothetical protein
MARIRIVLRWPDDEDDFDYNDIDALIRDPMYIADENEPEQEAYLRKYKRSFVRSFKARLRSAIKIAEKEGEEALDCYDLAIEIPGYEILFKPPETCLGAVNLDTEVLKDLFL